MSFAQIGSDHRLQSTICALDGVGLEMIRESVGVMHTPFDQESRHVRGGGHELKDSPVLHEVAQHEDDQSRPPRFTKIPRHRPPCPPPTSKRDAATQTLSADEAIRASPEHLGVVTTLHWVRETVQAPRWVPCNVVDTKEKNKKGDSNGN